MRVIQLVTVLQSDPRHDFGKRGRPQTVEIGLCGVSLCRVTPLLLVVRGIAYFWRVKAYSELVLMFKVSSRNEDWSLLLSELVYLILSAYVNKNECKFTISILFCQYQEVRQSDESRTRSHNFKGSTLLTSIHWPRLLIVSQSSVYKKVSAAIPQILAKVSILLGGFFFKYFPTAQQLAHKIQRPCHGKPGYKSHRKAMGIKGETLWDTSVAFVVISPVFVVARFICRLANHGLGSDDWTIVLGLVSDWYERV